MGAMLATSKIKIVLPKILKVHFSLYPSKLMSFPFNSSLSSDIALFKCESTWLMKVNINLELLLIVKS